jgi:hypothetical protein
MRAMQRKKLTVFAVSLMSAFLLSCQSNTRDPHAETSWLKSWQATNQTWRGVHLAVHSDRQAEELIAQLPALKNLGVNVLIAEVDYSFEWRSHPELRPAQFLSRTNAQRLGQLSRQQGIRIIPQINCLGHQSWAKNTDPLLTKYPQLDETPGQFPENKGIYCRSWCPQNPEVYQIIYPLIGELVDAFDADAFHAGMDEVFLLASEYCPRCRGGDPAKLFAKAVNDLQTYVTGKRGLELLIWGDRLLDASALKYSEWEASKNQTAGAIDLISKDVIICDWHYGKGPTYPSVPLLLEKGFRVLPSGWQPLESAKAFSAYAHQIKNPRLLGYLCTTWGKVKIPELAVWPPLSEVLVDWK